MSNILSLVASRVNLISEDKLCRSVINRCRFFSLISCKVENHIAAKDKQTTWLVNALVDATPTSLPALQYIPQSTSLAINESTTFIIPIVVIFSFLAI